MKYFEDITYDAMSEILGTSVGALKSSYHIAVKKDHNAFKSQLNYCLFLKSKNREYKRIRYQQA